VKDQACFTVVAGIAVDYLCSGFLMVRSNERTKALFKPEVRCNQERSIRFEWGVSELFIHFKLHYLFMIPNHF